MTDLNDAVARVLDAWGWGSRQLPQKHQELDDELHDLITAWQMRDNKEIENMSGLLMKYFVLKPAGNDPYAIASRAAMFAYAKSISTTNFDLSKQLNEWAGQEQTASVQADLEAQSPETGESGE